VIGEQERPVIIEPRVHTRVQYPIEILGPSGRFLCAQPIDYPFILDLEKVGSLMATSPLLQRLLSYSF